MILKLKYMVAIELSLSTLEIVCVISEKTNSETPKPLGEIGITPAIWDKIEEIDITLREKFICKVIETNFIK